MRRPTSHSAASADGSVLKLAQTSRQLTYDAENLLIGCADQRVSPPANAKVRGLSDKKGLELLLQLHAPCRAIT